MRCQERVEVVQDHARLHGDPACVGVETHNLVQMMADIDNNCFADGLSALRCAGAAWQHRETFIRGDGDDARNIFVVFGDNDADRLYLVMRRICRISPP
jgi:hypothetical protein